MALERSPTVVWLIVVLLGVGTFTLRLSFIALRDRMDAFPPRVERALSFVPAAVLAALVSPDVVSLGGPVVTPRLLAGVTAAVVAWRTGSTLATIGVGMGVLWLVRVLLG